MLMCSPAPRPRGDDHPLPIALVQLGRVTWRAPLGLDHRRRPRDRQGQIAFTRATATLLTIAARGRLTEDWTRRSSQAVKQGDQPNPKTLGKECPYKRASGLRSAIDTGYAYAHTRKGDSCCLTC